MSGFSALSPARSPLKNRDRWPLLLLNGFLVTSSGVRTSSGSRTPAAAKKALFSLDLRCQMEVESVIGISFQFALEVVTLMENAEEFVS